MAKKNNASIPEKKVRIADDAHSPFALTEAFRKITANIGFSVPKKEDGRGKVFCVTSAMAEEGKTTISVNVALSCAKAGVRTLLIDCDLRNPNIRRFFPQCRQQGLESYLSGRADFGNVLYRDYQSGLDVIVTRQAPPNPLFLLNSEGFDDLLKGLSQEYEYIIVDTPPLALVSDTSVIGQKTDGVIIVTRQKYSNHKVLKGVIDQLNFAKCNILGFILNDFSMPGKGYYGGKYGKYGYGYSSGSKTN